MLQNRGAVILGIGVGIGVGVEISFFDPDSDTDPDTDFEIALLLDQLHAPVLCATLRRVIGVYGFC
jgi:hypothetical protein